MAAICRLGRLARVLQEHHHQQRRRCSSLGGKLGSIKQFMDPYLQRWHGLQHRRQVEHQRFGVLFAYQDLSHLCGRRGHHQR